MTRRGLRLLPRARPGAATGRGLAPRDRAHVLTRLSEIQRELAATELDLQSTIDLVCERTHELTHADSATILLLDDGKLVHRAATGFLAGNVGLPVPLDNTLTGWSYRNNRGAVCNDTSSDERVGPLARERGILSLAAQPLLRRGDVVPGVISVASRRTDSFGEDDLQTLELLAVYLTAAVSLAAESDAKRQQVATLARFRTLFEQSPIGIVRVDDRGYPEVNPAMEAMLGYTAGELAAKSFAEYTHPDDVERNMELFHELMAGERETYQIEKRYVRKDGEVLWVQVTAALERDEHGAPRYAISMIENIDRRKAAEEELVRQVELSRQQALHDPLTGLPNRTLFRDRIEQAIRSARRSGSRVGVVVMDLDRFKEVNDSLGHHAGDVLLKTLGDRFQGVLRASDTVARLGGDEFGLLLPDLVDQGNAVPVVEKVLESLVPPIVIDDLPLAIEASIGIALYPDHGLDVTTLLQRADVAMYVAKEEGSGYSFYDESSDDFDPSRLTLVSELRRAIERRELVLFYQPKAALSDGQVGSVEALLRWRHPDRGLIPPDEFVPLAQETGLIRPLTLYVVDEALRQCADWQEQGLTLSIAVNLSMRNLLDVEFPEQIEELLQKRKVDPSLLKLEMTESTMLANPARAKYVLDRLAALGVRLSIDDFGTGYSSLAYLKSLPVSEIKIDSSFVMKMTEEDDNAVIVRSTIDLGRNLGLEVVAEGVETKETWDELMSLGCTVAQGYFLSRPMPGEDIAAWLRDQAGAAADAA